VEETGAKVDAGDIGRDVVDEFGISECVGGTCASGETESARIYGGDETTTEEDTSGSRTIKEVMSAEGRNDLESEQSKSETDTFTKWGWFRMFRKTVIDI
jgi:hypothetical protein